MRRCLRQSFRAKRAVAFDSKFTLVIDLKTAKELGIDGIAVRPTSFALADEVIEEPPASGFAHLKHADGERERLLIGVDRSAPGDRQGVDGASPSR